MTKKESKNGAAESALYATIIAGGAGLGGYIANKMMHKPEQPKFPGVPAAFRNTAAIITKPKGAELAELINKLHKA